MPRKPTVIKTRDQLDLAVWEQLPEIEKAGTADAPTLRRFYADKFIHIPLELFPTSIVLRMAPASLVIDGTFLANAGSL
jgi:hypothetical protein